MTAASPRLEFAPALSRAHHFQPVRHQLHPGTPDAERATPEWLDVGEEEQDGRLRLSPSTEFSTAAQTWLQWVTAASSPAAARTGCTLYIKRKTAYSYAQYVDSLCLFFGSLPLSQIRLTHIQRYQRARLSGDSPFIRKRRPQDEEPQSCPAKPRKVNQDTSVLVRILKCSGLWQGDLASGYRKLRDEGFKIVRALTPDEEKLWLDACLSNPEWIDIYHYSVLCLDTCMGTNEIRSLRLMDIDLNRGTLTVPIEGAKNKYRHRTLPIKTERAQDAVIYLLKRAQDAGASRPEHYLLPFRAHRKWYVDRPMTVDGFKKQWDAVREKTGLAHFRKYDLRHTAITRYAEAGAPLPVIMEMAGHVLPHMTQHYTQISQQAMAKAMRQKEQAAGAPVPQPIAPAPAWRQTSTFLMGWSLNG